MANDCFGSHLRACLKELAASQVDRIERALQANPNMSPAFTRAAQRLHQLEADLKPDRDPRLAEQSDAWMAYSAALALEMYKHGTCDGSRIFRAFFACNSTEEDAK